MSESIGTVFWEDMGEPGKTRLVLAFCENCQRSISQGNFTRRLTRIDQVQIVSPSGIAHVQHEDGDERTACGLYAAGPEWWWRL